MSILEKMDHLGLELPQPSTPGGQYKSVNIRGAIAYVAIQFPINNGEQLYKGRLGQTLSTKDGYKAAELCALNVVSQIHHKIGLPKIIGLNHIDIYFQAYDNWDESPEMANGASELFVKILDKKGEHSRAIFGVEKLPRNFAVGLTATFTLK